jgi:hypothetical protein
MSSPIKQTRQQARSAFIYQMAARLWLCAFRSAPLHPPRFSRWFRSSRHLCLRHSDEPNRVERLETRPLPAQFGRPIVVRQECGCQSTMGGRSGALVGLPELGRGWWSSASMRSGIAHFFHQRKDLSGSCGRRVLASLIGDPARNMPESRQSKAWRAWQGESSRVPVSTCEAGMSRDGIVPMPHTLVPRLT